MPLSPSAGGAIFDFDGVIIDSLPAVCTAVNGALLAHGFAPRSAAELRRFLGPPVLSAFAELTGAAERSPTVARAQRGLGAPDVVVVGDRHYDVDAARACGLRVIGVTWGIGDRDELRGADVIVERPAELCALLA
jgi:phosphoglycolate phosphatase-like HAD superfamily hydrolase